MIRLLYIFATLAWMGLFIEYIETDYSLITYNITCPDGWSKALNNCYYFNNVDQLSWDEARTECALKESDLLVIATKEELIPLIFPASSQANVDSKTSRGYDWVNIQTEAYKTDEWWVGLRYITDWKWMQYGGDNTLIHWRNEPDNFDEQHCCAINEYGEFSDEFCRSDLGFICSYGIVRGEYCPSVPAPNSWYMSDKACHFISPLLNSSFHLNWTAAQAYCSNLVPNRNCQLLSLYDVYTKRGLVEFITSLDSTGVMLPWWTGLNDIQTPGTYVWQNGSLADGSLITWVQSPSMDRSKHKDCGLMYQGGSIQDTACNKRGHYACERSAIKGQLNLGCRSGWLRGGRSCYLLGNNKGYTWDQASSVCYSVNAHLLRVDDLDEKSWVEALPLNIFGYWTGLKRSSDPGIWAWEGSVTTDPKFVKWNEEPNNSGGNEHCAEIRTDGTYNDNNCNNKAGYICEAPVPPGAKCFPGWTSCESSCYYIGAANDTVTWSEAKDRCNDIAQKYSANGYRLAVNDVTEQGCINTTLAKQSAGSPPYWTDLNDLLVTNVWQYSDYSNNPPNKEVISWAKEPNNYKNNENCAVITQDGFYNDYDCQGKALYICEQNLGTASGTGSLAIGCGQIFINRMTLLTCLLIFH